MVWLRVGILVHRLMHHEPCCAEVAPHMLGCREVLSCEERCEKVP